MNIGDKVIFENEKYFVEDVIIVCRVSYIQISNKTHRARIKEDLLKKDEYEQ